MALAQQDASGMGLFKPGRFLLLLAILLTISMPLVVAGTQVFYYRDYALFGYPLAHFHKESLLRGELPLWNPLSNCGLPHLAQWNTMTLYPPGIVYLLLPLPQSLNWFMLLHLLLAGLGMYRLAHYFTGHPLAACLAGIGYAFNGLMLHCLMWPNNIAGLAWAPWVILLTLTAARAGGWRIFLGGIVGGIQLLSGAPEIILLTWVACSVAAFWQPAVCNPVEALPPKTPPTKTFLRLAIMGLLSLGIAAAQLLPFAQLLAVSHRDSSFGGNAWAMPPWGFFNLIVPLFHATPSPSTGVYTQVNQEWTSSYYPGAGLLLLAVFSLLAPLRCRRWGLGAMVLSGLFLALGENGLIHPLLKTLFPPLGMVRFPIKFVALLTIILPLLAAFGLADWLGASDEEAKKYRRRLLVVFGGICLAAMIAGCWSWVAPLPDENSSKTISNAFSRIVLATAFLILLLFFKQARHPGFRAALGGMLLLLLAFDLLTHVPPQNPTVTPAVYQPNAIDFPSELKDGRSRCALSRWMQNFLMEAGHPNAAAFCLGNRRMGFCNWNLVDGVAKINGFFSLYPAWIDAVIKHLYRSPAMPPAMLDFMGVSHISTEDTSFGWQRRQTAMPFVTGGQMPRFLPEPQMLAAMESPLFNPRQEVLLPDESRKALAGIASGPVVIEKVERPDSMHWTIEAHSEGRALLVLSQTWYPCWQAAINGKPVEIYRANLAFQAIPIGPGRNNVQLSYVDRRFQAGCVISIVTVILCLAGLFYGRRLLNKRQNQPC